MHNCLKVRYPSFLAVGLTVRIFFFYQKTRGGCVTPPQGQGRRHGATIGGGGRGQFEVDSFHAPPIGIMLNVEKFAGDRSLRPPGAAAHVLGPMPGS